MTSPIQRFLRAALWALAALSAALPSAAAEPPLASYHIDPQKVSISGISSGAFMASQFHIAHSELVMGAGLVAGGLYTCAVLSVNYRREQLDAYVTRALDRCMAGKAPLERVDTYKDRVEAFAAKGWIDPLDGLIGDRVYLYTGQADETVSHKTVERTAELYEALGVSPGDIELESYATDPSTATEAGHSWVTATCCQPCAVTGPPFINDCDYDQAGAILQQIYGTLKPKSAALSGQFVSFDQSAFLPDGDPVPNGLNDSGVLYVPADCAAGATCALHVVLHGCQQSVEVLGDTFYKNIGVNEWADSNDIIVLYPQAHSVSQADLDKAYPGRWFRNGFEVNPKGCWNWWGYGYDDRFALKDGVQITALYGMIERLMGKAD